MSPDRRLGRVAQIVSIEVIETTIHHLRVDREAFPRAAHSQQVELASTIRSNTLKLALHLSIKVGLDEAPGAAEDLRAVILVVAMVYDKLINFDELGVCAHVPHPTILVSEEIEELAYVILVDLSVN